MMVTSNSYSLLRLSKDFSNEELHHNYHVAYLKLFLEKSKAVTNETIKRLDAEILEINKAFCEIEGQALKGELEMQFDFRHHKVLEIPDPAIPTSEDVRLEKAVRDLWGNHQHILALRLLEICISDTLKKERGKHRLHYSICFKLLGRTLLEIGMIDQGIGYSCFGLINYEKAQLYHMIGNFAAAAHYLGQSLKNSSTEVPVDEICQQISINYFLNGDFENSIGIIEDILPELLPRKQIFEVTCKSKKFATVLMISILKSDKIKNNALQPTVLKIKYPLCYKYLKNCYGTVADAYSAVKEIENDPLLYDELLKSLKHEPFVRAQIELDYSLGSLRNIYFKIFDDHLEKSLIYHPK